jgi:4-hydroxybenzoate polyprenyltransferase
MKTSKQIHPAIATSLLESHQNRWWIFQKERFPIFKYGLLIAIFSGSAVSYATLLQSDVNAQFLIRWLVAFISVFGFFLQIRIADEFKDAEDDRRYRPDRPVPRGLVTLKELGIIGILTALIQLGLALWLMPTLVWLLLLVWTYFGLMCCEFFVRDWLKAHMTIYMFSHMLILPLIGLYATAWADWLGSQSIAMSLLPFLSTCFCNGLVFEIGRKIRAPADEQVGVQTYSTRWQPRNAVLAWLLAIGCTAIAACVTGYRIQFAGVIAAIVIPLFIGAVITGDRFLRQPSSQSAQRIENLSGLWTLVLYFSLGILPFAMQFLDNPL